MSQPVIVIAPEGMTEERIHAVRVALASIGRSAAWGEFAAAAISHPDCRDAATAVSYADAMIAAYDERFKP